MIRCSYCKKPLDPNDCAVVHKHGKNIYYCHEHKGYKTEQQFFWHLILEILDESNLSREITNRITPFIQQYGSPKISAFLYEEKDYYTSLFSQKENNQYKGLDHKLNLIAKIFNRELPRYKFKKEKEDEPMTSVIYEPEFDSDKSEKGHPHFHTRETVQERKDRLVSKMEKTVVKTTDIESDPFMRFLYKKNGGNNESGT